MPKLDELVSLIAETQKYFQQQAQRQVNTALTLRNWLFGFYIAEYELNGEDRAIYGQKIIKELAIRLKHFKGMSESNLYLFHQFYLTYPEIFLTRSAKMYVADFMDKAIFQTLSGKSGNTGKASSKDIAESNSTILQTQSGKSLIDADKLINQLSFSHFIELIKADSPVKRSFYELEALKNNWSVRELQRAMNSMLYERTGLSKNKRAVLNKHLNKEELLPEDVFRNPYMLEFLGLKEETEYSESDLEQAIINHLQTFLLEMGRGFCFEARQKRITFDNTHYRTDLIFYHHILKMQCVNRLKVRRVYSCRRWTNEYVSKLL
ncbi:PDDEXK nuclease domain-containing protein [Paradesertivirga mongoliensis]|uniref:PDDEXK nuclease domain-containing protein n=1 Tax=Paradesertivirga mongoliensis TaxID=2100740 RepID=A0ABW4ZIZ8_9SPHI|nr:PDDEXK nuclease domain-containing protein [Pedobacter mongoliensis]